MESFTEDDEVFIIGGASIYKQTEKYLDFIYMTFIQEEYHGDISIFQNIIGKILK